MKKLIFLVLVALLFAKLSYCGQPILSLSSAYPAPEGRYKNLEADTFKTNQMRFNFVNLQSYPCNQQNIGSIVADANSYTLNVCNSYTDLNSQIVYAWFPYSGPWRSEIKPTGITVETFNPNPASFGSPKVGIGTGYFTNGTGPRANLEVRGGNPGANPTDPSHLATLMISNDANIDYVWGIAAADENPTNVAGNNVGKYLRFYGTSLSNWSTTESLIPKLTFQSDKGYIGIHTAHPQALLQLEKQTTDAIPEKLLLSRVDLAFEGAFYSDDVLYFTNDGSDKRLTLKSTSSIYIPNTNNGQTYNSNNDVPIITFQDNNYSPSGSTNIPSGNPAYSLHRTTVGIGTATADPNVDLHLVTAGTPAIFKIQKTTDPIAGFTPNGDVGSIKFSAGAGAGIDQAEILSGWNGNTTYPSGTLTLKTDNTTRLTIQEGGNITIAGNLGIGTHPTSDTLTVDGLIRMGSAGSEYANSSNSPTFTIYGSVSFNSGLNTLSIVTPASNPPFTVSRQAIGSYTVTFNIPFSVSPPAIIITPIQKKGDALVVGRVNKDPSTASFQLELLNERISGGILTPVLTDSSFSFIATGTHP